LNKNKIIIIEKLKMIIILVNIPCVYKKKNVNVSILEYIFKSFKRHYF